MNTKEKMSVFRAKMKENNVDAWIIPSSDPHQSEYVPERWKGRAFISGFTGSFGILVILADKAGLWTDGRYFIQAERQLEGSGITLFKMGMPDVPDYIDWIAGELKENMRIGFDALVFSAASAKDVASKLAKKAITIASDVPDILDMVWKDRPEFPKAPVIALSPEFTGETASSKIARVREKMAGIGCEYHVISSLDDIAWLYNIRGSDIQCNPVVLSYSLISKESAYLFIDLHKLSDEVKTILSKEGVILEPYNAIELHLAKIPAKSKIAFDFARNSHHFATIINSSAEIVSETNITIPMKAQKNEAEIKGMINAHIKDGAAMVKFFNWFDKNLGKEKITEISASQKLESFRKEGKNFVGLSFDTIAGYKEHGAIIHYSSTPETDVELKKEGIFLLDSGGQYLDGTTDITRTITLGNPTEEEIKAYTLVLKGHIDLGMATFLYGAIGANLDVLARLPLWEAGMNYNHGTGHGVGAFLNVHEGPQSISLRLINVKLEPGMILSNEPGFYKEGGFGIRTENLILVEPKEETTYGKFMQFKTLTVCPYDRNLIDATLLSNSEKEWLNNYHRDVFEKLSPYLNNEEKSWLKEKTAPI